MIKINAKYTPGPWYPDGSAVYESKQHTIAHCYCNWPSSDYDDAVLENVRANAKLIAIAPEMVDLLRETLVVDALSVDERRALFVKIIKVLNKGGIVVGGEE